MATLFKLAPDKREYKGVKMVGESQFYPTELHSFFKTYQVIVLITKTVYKKYSFNLTN